LALQLLSLSALLCPSLSLCASALPLVLSLSSQISWVLALPENRRYDGSEYRPLLPPPMLYLGIKSIAEGKVSSHLLNIMLSFTAQTLDAIYSSPTNMNEMVGTPRNQESRLNIGGNNQPAFQTPGNRARIDSDSLGGQSRSSHARKERRAMILRLVLLIRTPASASVQ